MRWMKKDSDFIKILSNTAWMVFDKVFLLALSLFVSVKIANYYGALGYGSYQYAVSIVAVFEIVTTFVDARVVKKKYLDHDSEVVVLTGTVARILLALLSVLGGCVFILLYQGGAQFNMVFMLLLLNMALGNVKFGMATRFEYLMKSKKSRHRDGSGGAHRVGAPAHRGAVFLAADGAGHDRADFHGDQPVYHLDPVQDGFRRAEIYASGPAAFKTAAEREFSAGDRRFLRRFVHPF